MKDRFKFRVWSNKENKMYKVHSLHIGTNKAIVTALYGNASITLDDKVLMQCTGLKDKNGKLIFEGDIINIWCKNLIKNQISEVKFCKEKAAFTFDYITDFNNIVPCTMEKTIIEVIGNIYENEEMLNEG